VIAAAADPGLFPEPERVDVPTMDGPWAIAPAGWRYQFVGEDGQWLLAQGHLDDAAVLEVLRAAEQDTTVEYVWDATWARELTACPEHPAKAEKCVWCEYITPGEPWWDWSHDTDVPQQHRNKPGYFPVTVIDVEV
jgi:hypothetical protein